MQLTKLWFKTQRFDTPVFVFIRVLNHKFLSCVILNQSSIKLIWNVHRLEYKVENKPGVDCLFPYYCAALIDTQQTMLADTFEYLWLAFPIKEEDEVVEEMETSSSLEEDSIPVLSRLVSCLVVLWCIIYNLLGTTKLQLPSTWSFVEHVFQ